MFFDALILLYVVMFIGTLLLVEGIYYFFVDWRDQSGSAINRRLRLSKDAVDSREVLRKLRRDDFGLLSRGIAQIFPALEKLIAQSGMSISPGRLMLIGILLFTGMVAVLRLLTPLPFLVVLLLALITSVALPLLVLIVKRHRRLKAFGAQLPEALDLIVRSVRAGHPVSAAFGLAAKELPDPIGTEFGILLDEMTYGLDIHSALDNMHDRVPHTDLHFFIMAIQIQYGTGGNLAEVLSNLSTVIRERFRMFSKVRAITAEGRFSAVFIGISPIIIAVLLTLLNPGFFRDVAHDALFWPLIGASVVLLVIGEAIIWKMINFKW